MADFNWIALLVAVLGAGGIGAAIREIASVFSLARKGVSGREDKRRDDIIQQRDHALAMQAEAEAGERAADARADAAEAARDAERDQRRIAQEELARARRRILDMGGDPGPWPDFDTTDNPRRTP